VQFRAHEYEWDRKTSFVHLTNTSTLHHFACTIFLQRQNRHFELGSCNFGFKSALKIILSDVSWFSLNLITTLEWVSTYDLHLDSHGSRFYEHFWEESCRNSPLKTVHKMHCRIHSTWYTYAACYRYRETSSTNYIGWAVTFQERKCQLATLKYLVMDEEFVLLYTLLLNGRFIDAF